MPNARWRSVGSFMREILARVVITSRSSFLHLYLLANIPGACVKELQGSLTLQHQAGAHLRALREACEAQLDVILSQTSESLFQFKCECRQWWQVDED